MAHPDAPSDRFSRIWREGETLMVEVQCDLSAPGQAVVHRFSDFEASEGAIGLLSGSVETFEARALAGRIGRPR